MSPYSAVRLIAVGRGRRVRPRLCHLTGTAGEERIAAKSLRVTGTPFSLMEFRGHVWPAGDAAGAKGVSLAAARRRPGMGGPVARGSRATCHRKAQQK